jgi:hypothetical protein
MIISATRAPKIHRPSRSQQPGIVLGLRYERRFIKTLRETVGSKFQVEYQPWFFYVDGEGNRSACAPDILLHDDELCITYVIEVKYTWVPAALVKLKTLYCPVVSKALGCDTEPLVVVKRLTPEAPSPRLGLLMAGTSPLFQWLESNSVVL